MELKTNTYNTESHALAKTMTTSYKGFLLSNMELADNVTSEIDYTNFIYNALFDYAINAAENIFSTPLIVEDCITKTSTTEIKTVEPPTRKDSIWTITLTWERFLEFTTGGDKSQNKIVKDIFCKAVQENKVYLIPKKLFTNPYDENKKGFITPLDINIFYITTKPTPQMESIKKYTTDNPKNKIKNLTANTNINSKIDYIEIKIHDWLIQGMQTPQLKKENEKKIRFFTLPKNLFANYVTVENYLYKKDTGKIGMKHIDAHFFMEFYRYISIHDTNITYAETEADKKEDIIRLSLKDFLLNLRAKIVQVYKVDISIRDEKENIELLIKDLNLFCAYTMIIASKYNYGFYGANFLPHKAEIEDNNILIHVYRPNRKKKFNPEIFKDVKKTMKECENEIKARNTQKKKMKERKNRIK